MSRSSPALGGGAAGGGALRLDLVGRPGSRLCSVSAPDAEAVRSIWADHLPLFLTTAALPLLDDWAATNRARAQADDSSAPQPYRQSRHGPGHTPAEAASLIGFLRAQAEADTPFSFNAL